MSDILVQTEVNLISSLTEITGTVIVHHELLVYGKIVGELIGKPGSRIIVKEGATVDGKVFADTLIVDGFVKGEVNAQAKLRVTSNGKIIGQVKAASLEIDPGAIVEAKVEMRT